MWALEESSDATFAAMDGAEKTSIACAAKTFRGWPKGGKSSEETALSHCDNVCFTVYCAWAISSLRIYIFRCCFVVFVLVLTGANPRSFNATPPEAEHILKALAWTGVGQNKEWGKNKALFLQFLPLSIREFGLRIRARWGRFDRG
eukprot:Hpha_TRINITY_DN15316_c6_g6::TRINITY_DN15316_c6_g6_i2::g.90019::m.90019